MLHGQPFTRFSVYGSRYRWQIAMVSPGMTCCEHTLNTLRYADRYACAEKLYIWNMYKHISKAVKEINNVESLRFMVAQFWWYLLVSFPHEFTSSMKTNFKRVIEIQNLRRHSYFLRICRWFTKMLDYLYDTINDIYVQIM